MNHKADRNPALAQILEDIEGCRAMVASMLLLDLPDDVVDELGNCDERLTTLILAVRRNLGIDSGRDQGRDAA